MLRVTIFNQHYDTVLASFDDAVKRGDLAPTVIDIGGVNRTRFDGTFSDGKVGSLVLIRVRDKTLVLRTDAVEFRPQFEEVVKGVRFIP